MTTPATGRAPIEAKAQAAGLSGAVAGVAVWALQAYVFKGTLNPGLVSLVYAVVPGALALLGAYRAPHTPRPVPPTQAAAAPPGTVKAQPQGGGVPPSAGPLPDPPAPGTSA